MGLRRQEAAQSIGVFFTPFHVLLELPFPLVPRSHVLCVDTRVHGTGSLDTKTLSIGGIASGAASSVFQALYNVMIKRSLPLVNGDTNVLLVYNVGLSSLLFIPV
eukprot:Polyplicarium_translucidae@DN2623_c0_g1_i5.p1